MEFSTLTANLNHLGSDAQATLPAPFISNWSEIGQWAYYSKMQPRLSDLSISGLVSLQCENGKC